MLCPWCQLAMPLNCPSIQCLFTQKCDYRVCIKNVASRAHVLFLERMAEKGFIHHLVVGNLASARIDYL